MSKLETCAADNRKVTEEDEVRRVIATGNIGEMRRLAFTRKCGSLLSYLQQKISELERAEYDENRRKAFNV